MIGAVQFLLLVSRVLDVPAIEEVAGKCCAANLYSPSFILTLNTELYQLLPYHFIYIRKVIVTKMSEHLL